MILTIQDLIAIKENLPDANVHMRLTGNSFIYYQTNKKDIRIPIEARQYIEKSGGITYHWVLNVPVDISEKQQACNFPKTKYNNLNQQGEVL